MRETGSTDFTVPQVVAEARTSLRSYYENFEKKDDLLFAVFSEAILETTEGLRRATALARSPVESLDRYVRQLFDGTFDDEHREAVPLISLHLRFSTEQPAALAEAFAPQLAHLVSILDEGARNGVFRRDIAPETLAILVSQLLVSSVHAKALTRELEVPAVSVDDAVRFCRSAVLEPGGRRLAQVKVPRPARPKR
jgi:AcrR family transcriptional regulator